MVCVKKYTDTATSLILCLHKYSYLQVLHAKFTIEPFMTLSHVVLKLCEVSEGGVVFTGKAGVLQQQVICPHHHLILEVYSVAAFIQHITGDNVGKGCHIISEHHLSNHIILILTEFSLNKL